MSSRRVFLACPWHNPGVLDGIENQPVSTKLLSLWFTLLSGQPRTKNECTQEPRTRNPERKTPVHTRNQNTLAGSAWTSGIALHTGNRVNCTIHPAEADTGIVFRRTDLDGRPTVRASLKNVVDTRRATTIAQGEARVHTVEHLLAALYAFEIDNALIEMDGPEPPVADGSAMPFVELIKQAGTKPLDAPVKTLKITRPHYIESGETKLVALPADRFIVTCTVKYNCTPLDCQYLSLDITADSFEQELALARTFCPYQEIDQLIRANLICGGSLDNAVVIKGDTIISKEGLRYPDEFVRHKILDLVGDFSLLEQRIAGQIIAVKPGHEANAKLAELLTADQGD